LTRTGTHTDTCTGAHTDTHTGTHPTETPVCDPDIWEKVRHKLSEMSEQPLEQIHLESSLRGDLCLDSIQLTELAFWTAEQFKYRPKLRELKNAASICSAAKKGTRT
ncbi:MAG: acyl carrier protein, partial [Deltaproteobacteria bacterium]|nr:acyl carrier protein [Deltaproteobacteria bacterium]